MRRIKVKALKSDPSWVDQEVTVKGWARTVRAQKSFTFIELNDGSSLSNLQVIMDAKHSVPVTTGCALCVTGKVVKSPGGKQHVEIQATDIQIIGEADPETYPLQKKRHSFEFLRTIAHLRPRTNTIGAVTRVRHELAMATHEFFRQEGFLYLHTPIITLSDCEGAGEMFSVSTLNQDALPRDERGHVDHRQDFFGKEAYLTVSGQLNAEIYAQALSDVYTFGPTFRAENSHTTRHLAEFWMIEPEMAFADIYDDMDLAERYLHYIFKALLDRCEEDMAFFDKFISNGLIGRLKQIVDTPFTRLTYTEAVQILEKADRDFEFPCHFGCDFQSEHERYLAEEHVRGPLTVYNYPKEIKPFYMRNNDDGITAAAMDVLLPGVGEIVGGAQREERLDVLEEKMNTADMNKEDYWWYLELRKYGSTPHAGFGAGFERLLMFATGMENVRDVIPFPRTPGNADF